MVKCMKGTFLEGFQKTNNYSISELYPKLKKLFTPGKGSNHLSTCERDVGEEEVVDTILRGYNKIIKLVINELWRKLNLK